MKRTVLRARPMRRSQRRLPLLQTSPVIRTRRRKRRSKRKKAKLWHLKRQGEGAAALAGHKRVGPVY